MHKSLEKLAHYIDFIAMPVMVFDAEQILYLNSAALKTVMESNTPLANPIQLRDFFDGTTFTQLQLHLHAEPQAMPIQFNGVILHNEEPFDVQLNLQPLKNLVTHDLFQDDPSLWTMTFSLEPALSHHAKNLESVLFKHFIQDTDKYLLIIDLVNNVILYMNKPHILGYDRRELLQNNLIFPHIYHEDVGHVTIFYEQISRKKNPFTELEYRVIPKNIFASDADNHLKHGVWISSQETVIAWDKDQNATQLLVTISEIGERKQFEYELSQRNRTLLTLHNISNTLMGSFDLVSTLKHVLVLIEDIISFDSASIFLLKNDKLQYIAGKNLPRSLEERLENELVFIDALSGHILEKKKPRVVPDTNDDPSWYQTDDSNYIRSWMGVPITYNNEVIGVLNFDSKIPGFYTDDIFETAYTISQPIALAIHLSRLYEQAQMEIGDRQTVEKILISTLLRTDAMYQVVRIVRLRNMQEVLPQTLDIIMGALNGHGIFLVAFDLTEGELLYELQRGDSDLLDWDVFWDFANQPGRNDRNIPNVNFNWHMDSKRILEHRGHYCASPVHSRGMLIVARDQDDLPFNYEDQEFIQALASQFTIAIENDTLTRRLQKQANMLAEKVIDTTESLLIEQAKSQAILDATGEGIIYIESDTIVYANPEAHRMLSYGYEQLNQQPWHIIYKDPSRARTIMHRLGTSTEHTIVLQDALLRKDGSQFPASIIVSELSETASQHYVAVIRDISQEQALYRQRMRFIANAAHELRTPLTSFNLRLHMTRRQPERMETHLEQLDLAASYLQSIVENLLELTRFEQHAIIPEYQYSRIQTLIDPIIDKSQLYVDDLNLKIKIEMPEKAIYADVDTVYFTNLVQYMVDTALNYAAPHTHIQLYLAVVEINQVDYLNIQTHHFGNPIEPELLPTEIFTPFSRPRLGVRRETGMELALAHEIVRMHKGKISAENHTHIFPTHDGNIEGGSIYNVFIPLKKPQKSKRDTNPLYTF